MKPMQSRSSLSLQIIRLVSTLAWVLGVAGLWAAETHLALELTPTITVSGSAGTYEVQWAEGLGGVTNWQRLTNVTLFTDPATVYDSRGGQNRQRFYRTVLLSTNPAPGLVWIPPGTFLMGSPTSEAERNHNETQHRVALTQGYWMGLREVTQGEYLSVVGSNPSCFRNGQVG